jgi:hypothetical protein
MSFQTVCLNWASFPVTTVATLHIVAHSLQKCLPLKKKEAKEQNKKKTENDKNALNDDDDDDDSADERTWLDVRFYGVAQQDCSNGGRRGWAEYAPCTDSTARNTLTSEALLNPLIPEHDGKETCRVGLAGVTLRPARTLRCEC